MSAIGRRLTRRQARRRGLRRPALAAGHQRRELARQLRPVAAADDVLGLADVLVPRMEDRGARDALLQCGLEVDRAVVDQQADADLATAADLVVRAVELV